MCLLFVLLLVLPACKLLERGEKDVRGGKKGKEKGKRELGKGVWKG